MEEKILLLSRIVPDSFICDVPLFLYLTHEYSRVPPAGLSQCSLGGDGLLKRDSVQIRGLSFEDQKYFPVYLLHRIYERE